MILDRYAGVAILVCSLVPLTSDDARAEDDGRLTVSLAIDSCVGVDPTNVRRVFLIELRTSIPRARLADAKQGARIKVVCDGTLIALQISDQVTGKSVGRRIDLSRTPTTGRDRLLALAVMELLAASWAELRTTPEPVVPSVDRKAPPAARRSARALVRRRIQTDPWTTTASLLGSLSRESYGFAGGGGIRAAREHVTGYGWAIDLIARTANQNAALGTISVRTLSAGVSATRSRSTRRFKVRGALGARVAMVTMSGTPDDQTAVEGGQLVGLAVGPFVGAGIERRVYQTLGIGIAVELGYHLSPVRGLVNDNRAVDVENAWLTTRVAVGWQW